MRGLQSFQPLFPGTNDALDTHLLSVEMGAVPAHPTAIVREVYCWNNGQFDWEISNTQPFIHSGIEFLTDAGFKYVVSTQTDAIGRGNPSRRN